MLVLINFLGRGYLRRCGGQIGQCGWPRPGIRPLPSEPEHIMRELPMALPSQPLNYGHPSTDETAAALPPTYRRCRLGYDERTLSHLSMRNPPFANQFSIWFPRRAIR